LAAAEAAVTAERAPVAAVVAARIPVVAPLTKPERKPPSIVRSWGIGLCGLGVMPGCDGILGIPGMNPERGGSLGKGL